jgi:hypothetical protein
MNLVAGQRWSYKRDGDGFICEITKVVSSETAAIKLVQIISGSYFKVGETYSHEDFTRPVYSLLEGQDAPK